MSSGEANWRRHWPIYLAGLFVLALAVVHITGSGRAQAANTDWKTDHGWLGVYIQTVDKDLAESEGLKTETGVLITGVMKDSPAEKAGIKKGDVIIRFDGKEILTTRRLTRLIEWSDPGEKKEIVVLRDGKETPLTVEVGSGRDPGAIWLSESPDVTVEVPNPPKIPSPLFFSLGQLSTSRIGLALYDISDQLAEHFGAKDGGALINEVEKDGPADKAGLQAGDIIVEIDHKPVRNTDEIRRAIQKKDDGETATVTVIRGPNERKTVDVKVESNDTWSGIGVPRRFRVRNDDARLQLRDALRAEREARRDVISDWRDQYRDDLKEQLDELREQLEELRQELKDLKN